jgi:hypothetical protein
MLHRNRTDSAVRNERPTYIARLDAQGNFRFQNLPRDTFAIYALGNAGMMRRYNREDQLFAFANEPVVPGVTRNVQLYAFKSPQNLAGQLGNLFKGPAVPANEKRLRFTTVPPSGNLDLQSNFVLNFQSPLRVFDSTLVAVTADTTYTPVAYSALLDSSRTSVSFRSTWRPGTTYNLILQRDFAEDSAGRKLLKTDTLNFTTKKVSDYGELNVRIRNLDTSRNPVLLFLLGDQVVFSTPIRSGVYRTNMFNPGDYELRILYDTNSNGKWDPGQFFGVRRQPELVQPIPRRLVIKAGLENEFDLSL